MVRLRGRVDADALVGQNSRPRETLKRRALLERGIIAGNKAERFNADGS